MALVGFIVNPIAGMGGRVGLKGTDDVEAEARQRGALPSAELRALAMLQTLQDHLRGEANPPVLTWLTCAGEMGADVLMKAGFEPKRILALPPQGQRSVVGDTLTAAAQFEAGGVDLVLFCGGDGTARDIAGAIRSQTPMLGIPAGVKMYSGVFGVSPARTAEVFLRFLRGELRLVEAEILDLDEEKYRAGDWVLRLHNTVLTPFEPTFSQLSKQLILESSESESKAEIASYLTEIIAGENKTLFILGPGSTLKAVADEMGLRKTLLGIDAVIDGKLVGIDLSEKGAITLLQQYTQCKVVLSPIGAQGFVLGRGNLQLSPAALRRIGIGNIIVVATPAKLSRTPVLRFDTGDESLDLEFAAQGYLPVTIGYRRERMVKIVV
jgi:predicted polyphosphate/ATP-dependent NAD kinase